MNGLLLTVAGVATFLWWRHTHAASAPGSQTKEGSKVKIGGITYTLGKKRSDGYFLLIDEALPPHGGIMGFITRYYNPQTGDVSVVY